MMITKTFQRVTFGPNYDAWAHCSGKFWFLRWARDDRKWVFCEAYISETKRAAEEPGESKF